jgi:hypothetical protein
MTIDNFKFDAMELAFTITFLLLMQLILVLELESMIIPVAVTG